MSLICYHDRANIDVKCSSLIEVGLLHSNIHHLLPLTTSCDEVVSVIFIRI